MGGGHMAPPVYFWTQKRYIHDIAYLTSLGCLLSENIPLKPWVTWQSCLRQHILGPVGENRRKATKMTYDVIKWRHNVKISPHVQKFFVFIISNFCAKIKLFGQFLGRLWPFLWFFAHMWQHYIFSTSLRRKCHNFTSVHANHSIFSGNTQN